MRDARGGKNSNRDGGKEVFWRGTIRRWSESQLSQAEFCRREGLNQNTLSSWKAILQQRDLAKAATHAATTVSRKGRAVGTARTAEAATSGPAFVKLEVAEDVHATSEHTGGSQVKMTAAVSPTNQVLAAELIEPVRGCRLRIFNGADQPTLSAVIAALAFS